MDSVGERPAFKFDVDPCTSENHARQWKVDPAVSSSELSDGAGRKRDTDGKFLPSRTSDSLSFTQLYEPQDAFSLSMAIKKSELYSSLWASCDALRGGMDASQYKDYVLSLLFIKYISDKYAGQSFSPITIPEGADFNAMIALKGKSDIGDQINKKVVAPLAAANQKLNQSDFPDFNDPVKLGDGKEKVDRLTTLVGIFQNPALDFSSNRAGGDDILGDAYEYLMRHFATESGKSKGQFYTPAEVSRIMAEVLGVRTAKTTPTTTVYDPTCGSGSLLLKVADAASTKVTIYGQEKDATTSGLARMNMVLHDYPQATIQQGNTLSNPKFLDGDTLEQFDYVVANPPFSDKRWSTGLDPLNDPHDRFESFGIPPSKQGDYAYLLHIVRSLKSTGAGACILPHGVLFRGNAEASIRTNLINKGYIKGIIGLPANLFYGTGIPACIIVIDKSGASKRAAGATGGIFMIDASKGYIKDGNKNRLRQQDIHRIVDTFNRQDESDPRYARMVPVTEIKDPKNDYNLNLPRYIDSSEPEDIQDIDGHLNGGIPNRDIDSLSAYWDVIPGVRKSLIKRADRAGYCQLRVPVADVKQTIYDHDEFAAFIKSTTKLFTKWKKANYPRLTGFDTGDNPKQLIETIAEHLLGTFDKAPLLDAYDVYQHLMDYWAETMQDDCYLIAADGWVAKPHRVIEVVKSGKKKGEKKDKGWACDLVPKHLIVARYFAKEQQAIEAMEDELAKVAAEMEELKEEHGGEEGILNDVSSKADTQEAWTEAIVPIWNEEDSQKCSEYAALVESVDAMELQLKEIGTNEHFDADRRNKDGSVGLAKVKARLKEIDSGDEFDVLTEYVTTDKEQKKVEKKAKQMLEAAETDIVKRLRDVSGKALAAGSSPLPEGYEELAAVDRYLRLLDQESELKSKKKEAEKALDQLAHDKYPDLSVDEIKSLVVDDKWVAFLKATIGSEVDGASQQLTGRVKELAIRYEVSLPQIVGEMTELSGKVEDHFREMGSACS